MLDNTTESLRIIADAIPYPVIYIQADGSVGFANRALRRANRLSDGVDGQPVQALLSAEENDNGRAAFMECLQHGRRVRREGPSAVPGAPARYCRYVYEPVRGSSGEVLGVCVTVVDLTDIKNAENELKASRDELQRSNRDLEQFAYVASHDLKAPLRSIEVLVGWLMEDLADHQQGDVQENLALLKSRTARLNRLLDDLLAYSRAGRRVGEICEVDVAALVEDVWPLVNPPEGFELVVDGDAAGADARSARPSSRCSATSSATRSSITPVRPGGSPSAPKRGTITGCSRWPTTAPASPTNTRSGSIRCSRPCSPATTWKAAAWGSPSSAAWSTGRAGASGTRPRPATVQPETVFRFEWKVVDRSAAERLLHDQDDTGSRAA